MQSKPREKGLYTTHTKLHILWPQQDSHIIGAFELKYILHGHIGQVVPVDVMKPCVRLASALEAVPDPTS